MPRYTYILFLIALLACQFARAQNYNNPGGNVVTCSGNFNDSGGPLSNYLDYENITTTICPNAAGQCVSVIFTGFDLESNYDYLRIYDGPSAASPLIGSYTGTNSPGTVTATSGCLTFVFTSDLSISHSGWTGQIACAACGLPPPCTGTIPACSSPAPDDCIHACSLGTLSAPPTCPGTGSSVNVFCLNNTGATAPTPYLSLGGCQPSGANMPNPAADVWYSFVASSNILDVRIQGLNTPSMGLYEGNNCNTFIGKGCAVGSFGLLTATFQPIFPGRKYYLQITGADTSDTGDFKLTLTSHNDCDPCLIRYSLTESPLPVGTVYQPGQRIHFCFTVTQWSPTSVNWLHAVVPTFGSGWNLSSLSTFAPPSCDGNGSWGWYSSVTSTQTGTVNGPGFFYESSLGCPSTCNPSNPGDNYGDGANSSCTGNVNFVFCWDITVAGCPPAHHGDNLNISINTYGDGESGSWTSFACAADPLVDFFSTLSCCPQPGLRTKNASCNGSNDGKAIAHAQGVAPFYYNWLDSLGNVLKTSTRNTTDTLTGLAAGFYSVEITDSLNCYTLTNFTINAPSALIANLNVTDISCNGQTDGSIQINASGGTSPYQYSLDGINFQAANSFSGLSGGLFTITVRDDSSCIVTQTDSINEPSLLVITLDSLNDASCFSINNGAIYTTISGGTPSYNYQWSNGGNTDDILNLPGGTFSLTVSDTRNCITSDTFVVNAASGYSLSTSAADASCNESVDGFILLTVTGGIPPFQFLWSDGSAFQNLNGVGAGNYSVAVNDGNNCKDTIADVVNEPSLLLLTGVANDALCYTSDDGSIQLNASGGIPPYQFSIDGVQFKSDSSFSNVPKGIYQPIARDAHNCTASTNLTVNTPVAITTAMAITDVSCFGGNDGTATVSATGQHPPYTYSWSNGSNLDSINTLIAGNYFVTITDSNYCNAYDTAVIISPFALSIAENIYNVQCNGGNNGSINLNVSGGTPSYDYSWSNGQTIGSIDSLSVGTYDVMVTDNHNCTITDSYAVTEPFAINLTTGSTDVICNGEKNGVATVSAMGGTPAYSYQWNAQANYQTTSSATNLDAGTYSVIVTDGNNCTDTSNATVLEPPLLSAVIDNATDPICYGEPSGSASSSASGGSGAYNFSWNTNPPTTGANVTGLPAGDYTVSVTDANGCLDTATTTLTDPPQFTTYILPSDTSVIYGDSIQLHSFHSPSTISPFYTWEPSGNILWCINPCSEPFVNPIAPTTFTVILTDPSTNCTSTAEAFVDVVFDNSLYVPNAFTPDGDGVNDEFEIFFGPELTGINYMIFDRWGEKLFQSKTFGNYWNGTARGKAMNPGVYIYAIEATYLDGQKKMYKGSFTLLR